MRETYGKERCEILADYVIDTGATVRSTAKHFNISKSTVHKDLSYKLKYVNPRLYSSVKEILDLNKEIVSDEDFVEAMFVYVHSIQESLGEYFNVVSKYLYRE